MKIEKTEDISSGDNIVLAVYGGAKSGKTSFAASTSKYGKTVLIDFEEGTKYLGERGIDCDIIRMNDWFTLDEKKAFKTTFDPYDSIVVDPVGEAMDFLITGNQIFGSKFRQGDGSLTMAGWGEVKNQMRGFIKYLRGTGKTIILVFHDDRSKIGDEWFHSLMISTKLKEVIPGMVEIISYLAVVRKDEIQKRVLYTPAAGGNYDSGDRTGRVPETVEISELDGWGDFIRSLKPKTVPENPETVVITDTEENPLSDEDKKALDDLDFPEEEVIGKELVGSGTESYVGDTGDGSEVVTEETKPIDIELEEIPKGNPVDDTLSETEIPIM